MVVALTTGLGSAVTLGLALYGWHLLEEIDQLEGRLLARAAVARNRVVRRG